MELSGRDLRRWRLIVVLTSATLFVVSLAQTAFVVDVSFVDYSVDPGGVLSMGLLLSGWFGFYFGPILFDFRGVAWPLNMVVWPCIVAIWLLACIEWRIAAGIAAGLTIGLISITPSLDWTTEYAGSLGYAAWLANPGIAITWILYLAHKQPASLISAVISLGLMLSFLRVQEGPFGFKQLDAVPIISYGIGYWLWVASAAILATSISAHMFLFRVHRKPVVGGAAQAEARHWR
jgi:hypothetical protein